MNNFIIAFIVPPMIKGIGWGMYLFFAIWLFIGAFFVWFFVPETKNKTLEEMDMVFGSIAAVQDQELMTAAREEVGLDQLFGTPASQSSEKPTSDDKVMEGGHLEEA
jgi:hypothetical protein